MKHAIKYFSVLNTTLVFGVGVYLLFSIFTQTGPFESLVVETNNSKENQRDTVKTETIAELMAE